MDLIDGFRCMTLLPEGKTTAGSKTVFFEPLPLRDPAGLFSPKPRCMSPPPPSRHLSPYVKDIKRMIKSGVASNALSYFQFHTKMCILHPCLDRTYEAADLALALQDCLDHNAAGITWNADKHRFMLCKTLLLRRARFGECCLVRKSQ